MKMRILKKQPERDFRILNLTDPQLADAEWAPDQKAGKLLEYTVKTLAERTKPNLITVSGDLAWAENYESYRRFAGLLDSLDVPWAPVFGNHDQEGTQPLEKTAEILCAGGKCLLERGDPALGYGNYVIGIEQNGKLIHGLILMDSHSYREHIGEDGKPYDAWSDVRPEQFPWYREQAESLARAGAKETTLILHNPLYTYREAAEAAFRPGIDRNAVSPFNGEQNDCFNEGYEDSFGVMYEGICSYPEDNGFFEIIKSCGSTKTILCGHDHVNSFAIPYQGVLLMYGLKTGSGCYWDPRLNGGTLLTVDTAGHLSARHIFVDSDIDF